MRRLKKTLDIAQAATEYVLCLLVTAMVVIVFAQVVFRFILRASLPWSEEAARYIMVWISMLGASIGVRAKGHIGVEAVALLLPSFLKKAVAVATTLVAAAFFAGMIYYGSVVLKIVRMQESPAMEVSMAVPYSSLAVGGALMLLYSVEELLSLLLPQTLKKGGAS